MDARTVLALDLATDSGWAIGPVGGVPRCARLPLGSSSSPAEKGARLVRWLSELLLVERPRLVVIERPLNIRILVKIGASHDTVLLLYGLAYLAMTICNMRGVHDVRFADVQDVREHFVGRRTFAASRNPLTGKKITSRAVAKSAIIDACRMRGWEVEDDNAADAAATWSYGCALLNPRTAVMATPLFGRASA